MKKYLVCPRYIISSTDGQIHHVTARELMRLYDVSPAECVVDDGRESYRSFSSGRYLNELIPIVPLNSGKYPAFEYSEYIITRLPLTMLPLAILFTFLLFWCMR